MKIKALAAAVALLSTATVAQAEWHDGNDEINALGDGELLLVAFDDVRKVSVVQDLGGSYVEFWENFQSTTFNKSFDLDPLFASTFTGSDAGNIQWSIFANNYGYADFDGFNEPARFSNGFMITTNVANPTVDRSIGNDFAVQFRASDISINMNGALPGAGDFSVNGAFQGTASNSLYAGTDAFYGNNLSASVPFNVTALSGETLNFWALLTSQTSNGANAGADIQANGYWALDLANNTVAYSAVPVPAAVWLLASGLLGLGAVSRRRKA